MGKSTINGYWSIPIYRKAHPLFHFKPRNDPPETWRPPGAQAPWKRDSGGGVPACNESGRHINGMMINPFSLRLNTWFSNGIYTSN